MDFPQLQLLDKVYMPVVVVASGAYGQTAQKTVEIPQLQFLDKVCMPVAVVASGAICQTAQKTVEVPQLPFAVFLRPFVSDSHLFGVRQWST